jgi:hypothetical protein
MTEFALFKNSFKIQIGADTDIGGGRENQDDYFIIQNV